MKLLCVRLERWRRNVMCLSELAECATPPASPCVHYGLWVVVTGLRGFILGKKKKSSFLVPPPPMKHCPAPEGSL